jgi:hypothetical protein
MAMGEKARATERAALARREAVRGVGVGVGVVVVISCRGGVAWA